MRLGNNSGAAQLLSPTAKLSQDFQEVTLNLTSTFVVLLPRMPLKRYNHDEAARSYAKGFAGLSAPRSSEPLSEPDKDWCRRVQPERHSQEHPRNTTRGHPQAFESDPQKLLGTSPEDIPASASGHSSNPGALLPSKKNRKTSSPETHGVFRQCNAAPQPSKTLRPGNEMAHRREESGAQARHSRARCKETSLKRVGTPNLQTLSL